MRRSTALRLFLALVALLAMAAPASAGGWATVHLDAVPANVAVEVPVQIGFTVLAHDITPVNVDTATLQAQHRETAETYAATALQEGATGHYVVEAVFPRAGEWKWSIVPEPYAGTSFETLTVLAAPAASSPDSAARPARIAHGSCATRSEAAYPLVAPAPADPAKTGSADLPADTTGSPDALPVQISETVLDVPIAELLASPHAITVGSSDPTDPAPIACGDIGGRMWNGELVVGLRAGGTTGEAGIATLREENGRTTITLYLIPTGPAERTEPASAGSADAVTIEIVTGGGHGLFSPSEVDVPVGTTVVWTNATAIAHTVTGDSLAFEDSGPLDPGDSFQQTFTSPGTYTYRCGPHPDMVGTITVT